MTKRQERVQKVWEYFNTNSNKIKGWSKQKINTIRNSKEYKKFDEHMYQLWEDSPEQQMKLMWEKYEKGNLEW